MRMLGPYTHTSPTARSTSTELGDVGVCAHDRHPTSFNPPAYLHTPHHTYRIPNTKHHYTFTTPRSLPYSSISSHRIASVVDPTLCFENPQKFAVVEEKKSRRENSKNPYPVVVVDCLVVAVHRIYVLFSSLCISIIVTVNAAAAVLVGSGFLVGSGWVEEESGKASRFRSLYAVSHLLA